MACCAATLERCGAHREERPNARSICHVIESGTRFRAQDHQGPRCPLRSLLVHRCARQHEVVRRHPRASSRTPSRTAWASTAVCVEGFCRTRGIRHARLPRRLAPSRCFRGAPESNAVGAHVLRHPHARQASPSRATRARCSRARSSARSDMGYVLNVGPELEFFYFKDQHSTEVLDHGGYFDLTSLDYASRPAPRHGAHPGEDGHSGGVLPPRERPFRSTRSTCVSPTRSPWPTP